MLVSKLLYYVPTQAIDTYPAAVNPIFAWEIKERFQCVVVQKMFLNSTLSEVYNGDFAFLMWEIC